MQARNQRRVCSLKSWRRTPGRKLLFIYFFLVVCWRRRISIRRARLMEGDELTLSIDWMTERRQQCRCALSVTGLALASKQTRGNSLYIIPNPVSSCARPFKRASESKEPRQAEGSPVSYFRIERSDIGVTATPNSK